MKKKISLLLCLMMTAIVCLTGCGKTQTTLEYDEAMIEQETEFLINYCQNVDSDTLAQWNDQNEFSKEYQFMMSGLKFTPDSFDGAVDSWQAGIKECGEYVGHGDYTFEAKDDELTVSVHQNRSLPISPVLPACSSHLFFFSHDIICDCFYNLFDCHI